MNYKNLIKTGIGSLLVVIGSSAAADVKVGMMLPFTGNFSGPGTSVDKGFKLYLEEQGGKLAGQTILFSQVDDEANPSKAIDNSKKIIERDKVDIVVGTVHSGVALALARVAKQHDMTLIIPTAGAGALTGPLCSKNMFRTSFTNWQPAYAMGAVALDEGYKSAVTITWKYTAGEEAIQGFKDSFVAGGGKVLKDLDLPVPDVEFQSLLTEIASIKPEVVFAFFPGASGAKFLKDYAASGLKDTIPLLSTFTTDGTLDALGDLGEGYRTTLHYADGLDNDKDRDFRAKFKQKYNEIPDVYAVQGYDAAQLLEIGLKAVNGDITKKEEFRNAMRNAEIDSPRGKFTLSSAGNPVQDIYLREVHNGENKYIKTAVEKLADPATGCNL